MRRTLFCIWGTEKMGKSTNIRAIYELIHGLYPNAPVNLMADNQEDIKVILTNVNGFTIGIESQGDPSSRMFQSLIDFNLAQCDIIICSSRTKGDTSDAVYAMRRHGYEVVWATNYSTDDRTRFPFLNHMFSEHILELIRLYHHI